MIVKHNIWSNGDNHFNVPLSNYKNAIEYTKNQENIVGHLKDEYEWGLLSIAYNLEDCIDEEVTITMDINNSGEVPIYFQQQGFELPLDIKTINPNEKVTVKLEGVYKNISYSRQLRFAIRDKGKLSFCFKNISAYKGYDVDVHLPYVGNLPEDKQPLLPPEGNYKEISDFITKEALNPYATKEDLDNFIIADDLETYAKKTYVDEQVGAITDNDTTYTAGDGLNLTDTTFSVDDTVARKSDIPSLDGLAKKSDIPDITPLATKEELSNYVEKVDGKGLSTNDFTDEQKTKVDNIPDDPKYTDTQYSVGDGLKVADNEISVDSAKVMTMDSWNTSIGPSFSLMINDAMLKNQKDQMPLAIWVGTQQEYDAIVHLNDTTLYFIKE